MALLNYTDSGAQINGILDGHSAVLMHGMFGSLSNLAGIGRALQEQGCRVVAVDMPNHGGSPHSAAMSYSSMAADVMAVIERLGLSKPFLVGHSMGGKTAMQMALSYPGQFAAVAVLDISPVTYPARHDAVLDGLQALDNTPVSSRREGEQLLASYVPDAMTRGFLLKNLYRASDGRYRLKLNLTALLSHYHTELAAAVSGQPYRGPILLLKGEHSAYIQSKHRPQIDALFPACQLTVVADAGHWLHAEQPQAVQSALLDFFSNYA
jgi:esterase